MLTAKPKSLLSWDFTVYDDGAPVAEVDLAWVRETGDVVIGDVSCTLSREGTLSGAFVLEAGGFPLVRAVKPSVFLRTFEITYNDSQYLLKAKFALSRAFALFQGDQRIGGLEPDHFFSRKMTIDLPETMPLAVRVFIAWLVVLMWKRAASSG